MTAPGGGHSGAVRVKICGLTRNADARLADGEGADYLGVVLTPGFGRSVAPEDAAGVVAGTRAARVAVLVDASVHSAEEAGHALGASVLQLHGDEAPETVDALRSRGPWDLWKAVRARSLDDVRRAVERWGERVDGLLVEGWREGAVGGAGLRLELDPDELRRLVPPTLLFVLAGGLTPERVGGAVARFAPDVVDVSSGVEASVGVKDPERVRAFVRAARSGSPHPWSDPSSS